MNFDVTNELLDTLKPYVENAKVTVCTENRDWRNHPEKSDYVEIGEQFSFKVFENEIIVFYFTNHDHFEDYTSELEPGAPDYIQRAKDFLIEIFQYRIKHVEVYKGKKLAYEKYLMIRPDDTEDWMIHHIYHGLLRTLNPFLHEREVVHIWKFDKAKGCFAEQ